MNIEEYRLFCLALPHTTEAFPFNETTLVFKVGGKMFALTDIEDFVSINLKCDPQIAIQLREEYAEVQGGFHMNKKHWNTIILNGAVSDDLIKDWISTSYELVVQSLTKKVRNELGL